VKIRTFSVARVVALLLLGSSLTSGTPPVSLFTENSVRIRSARVVRALGGGSYVTGMIEPSFGYTPVGSTHVHVAAYGTDKKLLGEGIDKINDYELLRWHLRPRPRASYTVFFPFEPTEIASLTIFEHDGQSLPPR
jgi:hypothetical protein